MAALYLHRSGTGILEQPAGIAHCFRRRDLISEKRHVGNDERFLRTAHDCRGVMNHHVKRHGKRRIVAKHGCRDRVADKQDVDARTFQQSRQRRVVCRQHGEALATLLAILQVRDTNAHISRA